MARVKSELVRDLEVSGVSARLTGVHLEVDDGVDAFVDGDEGQAPASP